MLRACRTPVFGSREDAVPAQFAQNSPTNDDFLKVRVNVSAWTLGTRSYSTAQDQLDQNNQSVSDGLNTQYENGHSGIFQTSHFNSIQMWRGIAVIFVIMVHENIISIGCSGVDIFLVISGFIMGTIGVDERPVVFSGQSPDPDRAALLGSHDSDMPVVVQ